MENRPSFAKKVEFIRVGEAAISGDALIAVSCGFGVYRLSAAFLPTQAAKGCQREALRILPEACE
jgi:hypothetical protein